jgi:hypothetical protein
LVVRGRAANDVAVREQVARAVPRALEPIAADDGPFSHRSPGVSAYGVDREDPVAVADHRELVDPGLELRRAALRDVGQRAEVERDPLRPGATPGVTVDVGPDQEHEIAADIRSDRQDQVADDGQPDRQGADGRIARSDRQGDGVDDQGDDHERRVDGRAVARLAVDVDVVRSSRHGRGDHRQHAKEHRDVGHQRLADQVGDDRDGQRTDRNVGDHHVDRMAKPGPVEEVLDRPDRPQEGPDPAAVEVTERL